MDRAGGDRGSASLPALLKLLPTVYPVLCPQVSDRLWDRFPRPLQALTLVSQWAQPGTAVALGTME